MRVTGRVTDVETNPVVAVGPVASADKTQMETDRHRAPAPPFYVATETPYLGVSERHAGDADGEIAAEARPRAGCRGVRPVGSERICDRRKGFTRTATH